MTNTRVFRRRNDLVVGICAFIELGHPVIVSEQRRIRAVLFDLDGVLVDATEWHYDALNRSLGLFGYSITRYEHLSAYNGLPTRKKLEMLSVEKGLPSSLHDLINRVKQVYTREEILKQCWPVFEKQYLMSRLQREGFRIAVCSNAVRDTVELMLDRSGLLTDCEFVISNEDVKLPKPAPEIYELAIKRMELLPCQVLVVEDAPHGVAAARSSGAHVCQVGGFPDVDYWRIRASIDQIERQGSRC
jgi:beta-phosphoglucomutase-like phosphatase (HAD superfamily)